MKAVADERLKAFGESRLQVASNPLSTTLALLVEKIPCAIPLFYLRQFYGIDGRCPELKVDELEDSRFEFARAPVEKWTATWWGHGPTVKQEVASAIARIIWLGKDAMPNAREFYGDFVPPADWTTIRNAVAWNSRQMLAIHAARFFLSASTAHSSNILVNADGKLFVIDSEHCTATDGSEIDLLFDNVRRNTSAFEILGEVAGLDEQQVSDLFENLPGSFEWPLGGKEKTVDHYIERLRLWKLGFEKVSRERDSSLCGATEARR